MDELRIHKTSEKILIWMHRNNLTQVSIAETLGVTRQAISQKLKENSFTPMDLIKLKGMGFKD